MDAQAEAIAACYFATFAGNLDDDPRGTAPGDFVTHTGTQWVRASRAPRAHDLRAAYIDRPMSVYFLGADGRGHVAALDLDGDEAYRRADRMAALTVEIGAVPVLDRSASGAHLWWPLTERIAAVALRRGLLALIQLAGLEGDPKVELRPSSDHGLGGCLRAPGTISPKDRKRSVLIDPRTGAEMPRRLDDLLAAVPTTPVSEWLALGERYRPPQTAEEPRKSSAGSRSAFGDRVGVSVVLDRSYGLANARPGRSVRCPCHDDAHASLSIAADDRRAWCHAPACQLHRDGRGVDAWQLVKIAEGAR